MSTVALIQAASSDGLRLSLTHAGTIKAVGPRDALARWTPALREHKSKLIEELSKAASAFSVSPTSPASSCKVVCNCGQEAALTVYDSFSPEKTMRMCRACCDALYLQIRRERTRRTP